MKAHGNLMGKPEVTLALLSYNQYKYIEEALQSCINQNFKALEILVCDDHSTDGTWEKINDLLANSGNSHYVKLIRNERRLGVSKNVNQAFAHAQGELVVFHAGDDISVAHRISALHEYWLAEKKPMGLCSDILLIEESGRPISTENYMRDWWNNYKHKINSSDAQAEDKLLKIIDEACPCLIGCASAYSSRVYEIFGPLPASVIYEDSTLTFRAAMAGRISYLDAPLIYYRQHGEALNNKPNNVKVPKITLLRRRMSELNCQIRDCQRGLTVSLISKEEYSLLSKRLKFLRSKCAAEIQVELAILGDGQKLIAKEC